MFSDHSMVQRRVRAARGLGEALRRHLPGHGPDPARAIAARGRQTRLGEGVGEVGQAGKFDMDVGQNGRPRGPQILV